MNADTLVNDYLKYNPKIHIAFLLLSSQLSCPVPFVESLIQTSHMCQYYKIKSSYYFLNKDETISNSRNNSVTKALLNEDTVTHLMFIDTCVAWNPFDVLLLMVHNKDVVGGVYPLTQVNFDTITQDTVRKWLNYSQDNSSMTRQFSFGQFLRHQLLLYALHVTDTASLNIQNNLAEVSAVQAGFMMVKREVFELMQDPDTMYYDDTGYLPKDVPSYTYFANKVRNNAIIPDDVEFCLNWQRMNSNNKIYVDITLKLTNTSMSIHEGCVLSCVAMQLEEQRANAV
jgi:hypothetical protein